MDSLGALTVSQFIRSPLTWASVAFLGMLGVQGVGPFSAAAPIAAQARPVVQQTSPAPQVGPAVPRLPYYGSADFTAEWIAPGTPEYASLHRVAPFSLRNQQGQVVSEQSLRGKIYVANFFFSSCPSVCPKMLANLRRIQDAFAADPSVLLVSHSVMPGVDSVDVLAEYADKNGIRPGKWHLLTGPKDALYDLARHSYFAEKKAPVKKDSREFLHTENLLLIDGSGHIRGVYNATLPLDAERVIEDIRLLQKE